MIIVAIVILMIVLRPIGSKKLGFEGFDSSRLLILRGGNSHVRWIWFLLYVQPAGWRRRRMRRTGNQRIIIIIITIVIIIVMFIIDIVSIYFIIICI